MGKDLNVLLKLLQISGLAPFNVGPDRQRSKKSPLMCGCNLFFAFLVIYNTIWAENDSRNDVDYSNKSFLIGIAFDTVDVLENLHVCFVSVRSIISANTGIDLWFKIKSLDKKFKELNVEFDDCKLKKFIYLETVIFVFLSIIFLAVDIILCIQLDMYYTVNYWILCAIPLLYNSIVEASFGGFVLMLYQRFWIINEFLRNAIDFSKENWDNKAWHLLPPNESPENFALKELSFQFIYSQREKNTNRTRIQPSGVFVRKKPPCLVMLKNPATLGRSFHLGMIRSLKILYFELFDISTDLNFIFGWNLLFIFAISFFGCTINLYFVIIFHLRSYDPEQYVSSLSWVIAYLFKVVFLTVCANIASKEAGRTTDLLHILLSQTDFSDTQTQSELTTFCLQNSQCKVKFRAADVFVIDRTILFQFLAGVLSNVIFIVQFDKINFSTH